MEKFLYLFRGVAPMGDTYNLPQEQMQKWMKWMESLGQKGILVGGEPLQSTGKFVSGSKKVVTDGPFVEAKELVGGYLVVNAKDINDAVEISKGCPILEYETGIVEVREIQELKM